MICINRELSADFWPFNSGIRLTFNYLRSTFWKLVSNDDYNCVQKFSIYTIYCYLLNYLFIVKGVSYINVAP